MARKVATSGDFRVRRSSDGSVPIAVRLLVASYPRQWRHGGRGDELIAVLLDGAQARGQRVPSAGDIADVVRCGLRERRRLAAGLVSDSLRTRLAEASLLSGMSLCVFLLVFGEVKITGISSGRSPNHLDALLPPTWGPFLTLGSLVYLTWVGLFAAYLADASMMSRELAKLVLAEICVLPWLAIVSHHQRPPGGLLVALIPLCIGVLLVPATGRLTRRRRLLLWGGLAVMFCLLVVWRYIELDQAPHDYARSWLTSRPMFYWNPAGKHLQINRALVGAATAAVCVAGGSALLCGRRGREWFPVIAYLLLPVSLLRLGTTAYGPRHEARETVAIVTAVLGLVVLLTSGAGIALRARRRPASRLRRMRSS